MTFRRPGAGLAVLTLINLFNYLDRWVVAAVAESIKRSELRLSDTELGALMTGFIIVYTLTAPVFGRLGDTDRKSTRLNSSHSQISYAVFCLKKKKKRT